MISIEQLSVSFGGHALFEGISFLINTKERIALVGKNGAGKTTLMKLIVGQQMPTSGSVNRQADLTIGYLPQHMIHNEGTTVLEETEKAFEQIISTEKRIDELTEQLAQRTDYETESYHQLIDKLTQSTEYLQIISTGNFHSQIEKTLIGLGFQRTDFDRQCSEFSGGWRMRIELAKILLQNPNVLLLDEPTNHLDIESIQWLENFLITTNATVLLVSHDKAFLDNVTTRTIEIVLGDIHDYNVGYSKYLILREERRQQQLRAYENQQKMIKDTEDFIDRFRYQASKSVQVQSRIKQLEKIERIEVDEQDRAKLNLKFPPAPASGIIPVEIENLSKSYGEKLILNQIDAIINRGEKVAFVGKNGEGKSTLVKCIMEQISYTGVLKMGHNVKIGYFAQNQASLLDPNLTVFETIDNVAVGDIRTKIRDILGAFMFGGEASDKKVKVLSGGEKSRLAMIKLLLEPINLLILDEPTNHLDISSKEVLKEAIKSFEGTAIIVSHDREFLDGLVTKVYEFTNKKIKEHLGGIYEFLEHKKIDSLRVLEQSQQIVQPIAKEKNTSENKQSYEARKEQNRKIRKLEKEIEVKEKEVERMEKELNELQGQLQNPEKAMDADFVALVQKKQHQLEQKIYEWEIVSEELEMIK